MIVAQRQLIKPGQATDRFRQDLEGQIFEARFLKSGKRADGSRQPFERIIAEIQIAQLRKTLKNGVVQHAKLIVVEIKIIREAAESME